jgi:hypothetical protein
MKRYSLEHGEQVRLMTWAGIMEFQYPELALLYAIPNGGQRNIIVAKRMKDEGMKAGVPDLHLPVARGDYHSLYIEMKAPSLKPKRGGKGGVSALQANWHRVLSEQGNRVVVCYGFKEAETALTEYLSL